MSRFKWTYDNSEEPAASWDRDLSPNEEFVTVPSLGSIVPDWLLFLPRNPIVNISSMPALKRKRLINHSKKIMSATYGLSAARNTFYFEHGANKFGSLTGCGADQSHLHGVILPFDLCKVFYKSNPNAIKVDLSDPWQLPTKGEYLICYSETEGFFLPVEKPVSQFFRKLIAEQCNQAKCWNYKDFPFHNNINTTLQNFHGSR